MSQIIEEYRGIKIEKFEITYEIKEDKFSNINYIILSPAYMEINEKEKMYLPYYCYDEDMNLLNFDTLEEAKSYINKYMNSKEDYEVRILHREEISVIPKNKNEKIE